MQKKGFLGAIFLILGVMMFGATTVMAQTSTPAATTGGGGFRFQLPPCVQIGNCTLDDIVRTGASFANFLTGLSAALFFATFVYGGARYLLSFGKKESVEAGKKAMTGAAIGMGFVLGAWTLVNYVANSLQGIK
jgi:type IV secretion system pilin